MQNVKAYGREENKADQKVAIAKRNDFSFAMKGDGRGEDPVTLRNRKASAAYVGA